MRTGTVYILGAGASQFAGFPLAGRLRTTLDWAATSGKIFPSPPIKKDAEPGESGRHCLEVVDCIRRTLQKKSTDLEVTLTLVDLVNLPDNQLRVTSDLEPYDLKQVPGVFAQLITETFQNLSSEVSTHIYETTPCGKCEDRQNVMTAWASLIHPGNTLITFNWDLLHEMILWKARKWDCRGGYGFRVGKDLQDRSAVTILKLHGSCNWAMRSSTDSELQLDHNERYFPWSHETKGEERIHLLGSTSDFGDSLILPSYLKTPWNKPVLLSVWQQASDAIKTAEKVIVIGYSLPLADAPSRTMLSLALKHNESLKTVSIVMPKHDSGDDAHARWRDFCSSVGKSVQPIYKKFEEYVLGI